ncbi:MAG: ribosome maturation factor RimP [Gemmatimonadota bacterium]
MADSLERAIERVLDELGFELVVLEKGGGRRRPLLRLRVDRPDGEPGRSSLTADDCARVSREVMEMLDAREDAAEDFILEVSSPGVERPLVRARDYRRFAGHEVRLRGYGPLVGDQKQIDALLVGYDEERDAILLEKDGEPLAVPMSAVAKSNLTYRFEGG